MRTHVATLLCSTIAMLLLSGSTARADANYAPAFYCLPDTASGYHQWFYSEASTDPGAGALKSTTDTPPVFYCPITAYVNGSKNCRMKDVTGVYLWAYKPLSADFTGVKVVARDPLSYSYYTSATKSTSYTGYSEIGLSGTDLSNIYGNASISNWWPGFIRVGSMGQNAAITGYEWAC